jgi:hypothetical protein
MCRASACIARRAAARQVVALEYLGGYRVDALHDAERAAALPDAPGARAQPRPPPPAGRWCARNAGRATATRSPPIFRRAERAQPASMRIERAARSGAGSR